MNELRIIQITFEDLKLRYSLKDIAFSFKFILPLSSLSKDIKFSYFLSCQKIFTKFLRAAVELCSAAILKYSSPFPYLSVLRYKSKFPNC